jgi:site-specific recombinase XerD
MIALAPLIATYIRDYMPGQRGYSSHSCEAYADSLRLLIAFVADRTGTRPSQLGFEQLDANVVLQFLGHIEADRHNGVATRNLRLSAIRSFMRYVEYRQPSALEQIRQIRAIPTKRYDQKLIRHLSIQEIQAILNAPDTSRRLGIRDRAMMHLCFAAGLRVSELVALPIDQLTLGHPAHILVRGKGRKERSLPLLKQAANDLRAWLSVRGRPPAPELFVNAEGTAMTRAGFEYILDKHARAAAKTCASLRDRSVSPHQLRHSCAVAMLQATHDIRRVALWLGHADIRTTEVYVRMDPTEKLEAVEAVVPPSLRRGRFKAPDALIAMLSDA